MIAPHGPTKAYLGDGVYIDHWLDGPDASAVVLTTENGVDVTNAIYLEGDVLAALLRWISGQRPHVDVLAALLRWISEQRPHEEKV